MPSALLTPDINDYGRLYPSPTLFLHHCHESGMFMVVSFLMSWSPYAIVALTNAFADPRDLPLGKNLGMWLDCLAPIFAKASSCFSAISFIVSNKRYRKELFGLSSRRAVSSLVIQGRYGVVKRFFL